MCGICGTIGINSPELVDRMNREMVHRGPDDIGIWRDSEACLGHTRLSVIDLSNAGHQPMSNENDTIWITCNGEVYNFQVLRERLEAKGHLFKSNTDTEVILHLYEEYGERSLDYMRGMFSFAIWDRREDKLFVARDRFGIKPFFYSVKDDAFIFSSELKAMLASGFIKKEINTKSLSDYFAYGCVQAPNTLIKGIFQLLPAHYIIFKNGALKIEKYWELGVSKNQLKSEETYISDIKVILDDAVKMRLVSDVSLGAFLSGGVDSSAIVALMQRHSSSPIKTFSVIFEEGEYDERKFSRKIAKMLGTNHTEILLKERDVLEEIPSIFDGMDQPSMDFFNIFIISKTVKKTGLKVALSGLGGDEIFAGYRSFRTLPKIANILKFMKIIPQSSKDRLFKFLRPLIKTRYGLKFFFSVLKCAKLEDLYLLKRMVFLPGEVKQLLTIDTNPPDKPASAKTMEDAVNRLSLLEFTNYLQNMLLQDTDRMSMANSLEVRVPFLDHLLVEKIFEIPGKVKLGKDYPKRLLVKAVKDLLPDEVHNRPKMGFVLPFDKWLKGELRDYCEERFSMANLKKVPFLDSRRVNGIWLDFLRGSKLYNHSSILTLISFINWYEKNIVG